MPDVKLEIVLGPNKFAAEGSEAWVEAKYKEFRAEQNISEEGSSSKTNTAPGAPSVSKLSGQKKSLAIFLKDKKVGASQVKRFLATAIWLSDSGEKTVKTSDVSKALLDSHQKKLGNPADVLNQNVAKGFCVKDGEGFYVTPEGEESLTDG